MKKLIKEKKKKDNFRRFYEDGKLEKISIQHQKLERTILF